MAYTLVNNGEAGNSVRSKLNTMFNELYAKFTNLAASLVTNDSAVTGTTVKDALNTLNGAIGGGGAFVTVGATGADYATIEAAIAGEASGSITLKQVDDVTVRANITGVDEGFEFIGDKAYTLNFSTYNMSALAATDVGITFRNAKITYGTTASGDTVINQANLILNLVDCKIVKSTTSNKYFYKEASGSGVIHTTNVDIDANNANGVILTASPKSSHTNTLLIGGGTSCVKVLETRGKVKGITFTGTFSTTAGNDALQVKSGNVNGATTSSCTTAGIYIERGNISDISKDGLTAAADGIAISTRYGDPKIENFVVRNINFISGGTPSFSNGEVQNAQVVNNLCEFNLVKFKKGVQFSTGSDNSRAVFCSAGASGGGTYTFTIDSGINNIDVRGWRSELAIANSGTGTIGASDGIIW